jgi:hypothetical protein
MKTLVLLVLLGAAVAMYYGYGPSDLVALFQPRPATVVKHSHATAPEPTSDAPTPVIVHTTTVVASAPDGSLASRWSPYPSASPTATVKH